MLKFYYSGAPNPTKVTLFLEEAGLPYEPIPIDCRKGDQHKPEYLAVNPEAKVPTLLIDGRQLTEVAAILYYLAKRFPEAGLWPVGGLEAEAQAISWMSFIASTVHPARRIGTDRWREVFM